MVTEHRRPRPLPATLHVVQRRLANGTELPQGVSPHSLRHFYATEALRLGAALQDVQDALGHADPRTTGRYDRSRHTLDRSPNYLLAAALASEGSTAVDSGKVGRAPVATGDTEPVRQP